MFNFSLIFFKKNEDRFTSNYMILILLGACYMLCLVQMQ